MPKKNDQKKDTTVVIAVIGLIGTIVTALIASPILPKLLGVDETPTPVITEVVTTVVVTAESSGETPIVRKETLVFSNDFGDENTSGFAFDNENWQVRKEKNNPLLEMSGLDADSGIAVFGPNDFEDGRILFRFNYRNLNDIYLHFRSGPSENYSISFSPAGSRVALGYENASNNWNFEPFGDNSVRPFQFNENVWYDVTLEVLQDDIFVWIDGNKILTASDSRLGQGGMEFSVFGDTTVWIDDVEVWQYTYEPQ